MKAGPLVRGLLLMLPLSFLESGCKTKSSRNTPEAVPAASNQAPVGQNNQNCGVGLYLVADPLDSLSALTAPSLTANPINKKDFTYASFEAATPETADVVYYRGCPSTSQGTGKVKCSEKDADFFHSILWETAGNSKLKDTRFWFGANQKVSAGDSSSRQYTVQAFSCVWWDRASDAVKSSANKFSLKSFDLYCGQASSTQNITIKRSANAKANYYAQYAQNRHDRFIENNFKFYRASIDYIRKSKNANDTLNYSLGNISRMGPQNFLNYSGSMDFVGDLVEQSNPSSDQLSLTTNAEQPVTTLCNQEDVPAPIAPPPPAVQDPTPPLPAAPPPAELPTQPAATAQPEVPANVDPTEKDKLACAERDIREKASLSGQEPGSYTWDDKRKVCSYTTSSGEETDVPDVGNDVMPVCSTQPVGKSNAGAYAAGSVLIVSGALLTVGTGIVVGRAFVVERTAITTTVSGASDPVDTASTKSFFQRLREGSVKDAWANIKGKAASGWKKLYDEWPQTFLNVPATGSPDASTGWKNMKKGKLSAVALLGIGGGAAAIIGGSVIISKAKNKNETTKTDGLNLTTIEQCLPPSAENQALLGASAEASNASLDMHTAESAFLNSF